MIEIIHPEVQVPDLLTHIQRHLAGHQPVPDSLPADRAAVNPILWDQIAAQLQRAEQHAYMGRSVPELKRLRGWTRWLGQTVARGFLFLAQSITKGQREYNVATVHAVRDLADAVRNLAQCHAEEVGRLEQVGREDRAALEGTLRRVEAALRRQEAALAQYQADLKDHGALVQEQQAKVRDLATTLERHEAGRRQQEADLKKQGLAWHNLESAWQDHEALFQQQAAGLQRQEQILQQQAALLQTQQQLLQEQAADLRDKDGRMASLEKTLSQLRTQSHVQEGRLRLVFEETRRRSGTAALEGSRALAQESDHWLDALYLAFEDQFRGSRQDIKTRLQVYLPRLREAVRSAPVLDVGCGRGEWLELMRDEGIAARGVDLNRLMVAECRQRGLDALEGDALAHLRSLPDACLGAVTGFHLIEHLPWEVLLSLLEETVRVLQPGGLALFETPNPENVLVGASTFWGDPTHRRPLFPATMQFLAEQRGLVQVEIWRVNQHCLGRDPFQLLPTDHELAPRLNPLLELAKERFFAAPDFALVGNKVL